MRRFRLIPVEVDALQWKGILDDEARAFIGGSQVVVLEPAIHVYPRLTDRARITARPGDWLIRSDDGSLDVETDADFQQLYTPVLIVTQE